MDAIERRRHRRSRSLLEGRIWFNRRQSTMDCLVRNLSEGGALIDCAAEAPLPAGFELEIPRRGLRRAAALRWRLGRRGGVAFG